MPYKPNRKDRTYSKPEVSMSGRQSIALGLFGSGIAVVITALFVSADGMRGWLNVVGFGSMAVAASIALVPGVAHRQRIAFVSLMAAASLGLGVSYLVSAHAGLYRTLSLVIFGACSWWYVLEVMRQGRSTGSDRGPAGSQIIARSNLSVVVALALAIAALLATLLLTRGG